MRNLFANDEALRPRDRKGRFATAERAYADKQNEENKLLRMRVDFLSNEKEKYLRAYLSAANMASKYHRELIDLKEKLKAITKG